MFNCKYFLIFCLFSLLSAGHAQAATTSCTSTNCETLGYTMTAAACNGQTLIRCPFDTNKVICRPSLDTPVFNLVQNLLQTHANANVDNIRLETSLDDLCDGDWMTNCSYSYCWDMDGSAPNVECDETDFELFLTVGDIVTWVENKMMGGSTPTDPCEGYVTVDANTEICTSYCSTDSSKCMIKRAITCDEAITKAGGTKLTSGSYTNLANTKYFLTKDISFTSTVSSISSVQFYEASSLPACAKDSSVTKHPKLSFNTISNITYATFEVDTSIRTLYVQRSKHPSIGISRNFKMSTMDMNTSVTYPASVTFYIQDHPDGADFDVTLGLECEDSDENYDSDCTIIIDDSIYSAQVSLTWCSNPNGYGTGKNKVTCTGTGNTNCTQSEDEYACYF